MLPMFLVATAFKTNRKVQIPLNSCVLEEAPEKDEETGKTYKYKTVIRMQDVTGRAYLVKESIAEIMNTLVIITPNLPPPQPLLDPRMNGLPGFRV